MYGAKSDPSLISLNISSTRPSFEKIIGVFDQVLASKSLRGCGFGFGF